VRTVPKLILFVIVYKLVILFVIPVSLLLATLITLLAGDIIGDIAMSDLYNKEER